MGSKRVPLSIVMLSSAILATAQVPVVSPLTSCRDAANCNMLGDDALKHGDIAGAIQFFKDQAGYAEDAQTMLRALSHTAIFPLLICASTITSVP